MTGPNYEAWEDVEAGWFRQHGSPWHRGAPSGGWCGKEIDWRVAQTALRRPSEMPISDRCRECVLTEVAASERRIEEIDSEIGELVEARKPHEERRAWLLEQLAVAS